ncbi:NADH-quinone oxidoreductase subunit L [Elusimicrobiota bacterium]
MIEYPIAIIFIVGAILMLMPSRFSSIIKSLAIAGSMFCLIYGIYNLVKPLGLSYTNVFVFTYFSALIGLGCTFIGFIVVMFSMKYANSFHKLNKYYSYIFFSISFSLAAVYSKNLLVLLIFWGLSGLMLYLLANLFPKASNAAKKAFVFIGASDAILIFGMAIFFNLTKSLEIYDSKIILEAASPMGIIAFICFITAALTKAGAMPFHTWIPDFADDVPLSISAFLPASIDKMLGIFLAVLICNQLFVLNSSMTILLLVIGGLTILLAVYMAMVQHDMKKLLSYHAVSQVGYMILGIATGSAIGIAGSIFHMLNNAIYKSGLFLSAGAVEHHAGSTNLDKLGGLSKFMPYTFAGTLIFALAISGIPILNGFVSKWMIYQSLILKFNDYSSGELLQVIYGITIVIAMFGSALTMASFMKLLHAVFLGQTSLDKDLKIKEAGNLMLFPIGILAALCFVFGIFPYKLVLNKLIIPSLEVFNITLDSSISIWKPDIAFMFILFGLLAGVFIYLINSFKFKMSSAFVGGEKLDSQTVVKATEFYNTVSDISFFKWMYFYAKKKYFDIYEISTKVVLKIGAMLSFIHSGNLRTYLLFYILGFVAVYFYLVK